MRKRIYEWMGLFSTEKKGEGGGFEKTKDFAAGSFFNSKSL